MQCTDDTSPYGEQDTHVFFDIDVYDKMNEPPLSLGRIVCRLYTSKLPRTTENFRQLCKGVNDPSLGYSGSIFHRVCRGFIIQGGDIENSDGTGGWSIYGGEPFADENFLIPHNRAGLLSMANCGPHSNTSQFFFTLAATPQLDGLNVCFGEVVLGLGVLRVLERLETLPSDVPIYKIRIAECGELPCFELPEQDELDKLPDFPEDCNEALHVADKLRLSNDIRRAGNHFFETRDYSRAAAQYSKALRYLEEEFPTCDEEKSLDHARSICLANRAACHLKLERGVEALDDCNLALNFEPCSSKALYRRAKANAMLK